MRFKLMASLLSLLAMPAFAQESRDWSLGALQKTEFTEAAAGDSASFSVTWEKQHKRVKSGRGVVYKYLDIKNYFIPSYCIIEGNEITEDELRRFQMEFDLSEQSSRRLRDTILFLPPSDRKKAWKTFSSDLYAKREQVASGRLEGDFNPGPDSFDITSLPVRASRVGISVSVGPEIAVPLGAMANLCSPLAGICPGLEIRWGDFFFLGHVSFRTGHYTGQYFGMNTTAAAGSRIEQFIWRTGCGYMLAGNDDWELSVYFAMGNSVFRISPVTVSGLLVSEGIRFDYRLRKCYRMDEFSPTLTKTRLFSRLYLDQVWIAGNKTFSPSVNCSIGINFSLNVLSRN